MQPLPLHQSLVGCCLFSEIELTPASSVPLFAGNWNDLAASEDWSEEDWSGQLETKVFTASSSSGAPPAPPDTASIMQLLKEVPNSGGGEGPSSAPPSQQQQAPTLSVAQFNQQATETIKAAVGVSGLFSSGSSLPLWGSSCPRDFRTQSSV